MTRYEQVLALQAKKDVADKHALQLRVSNDIAKELEEECRVMRVFFQDNRVPSQPPTIAGMEIIKVEGTNIMEII